MDHYGLEMEKINARQAHENGDAEQSHNRFKEAVDQACSCVAAAILSTGRPMLGSSATSADQRNAGRKCVSPRNGPCSVRFLRHGWRVTSERGSGSVPAAPFMWTGTSIRSTAV